MSGGSGTKNGGNCYSAAGEAEIVHARKRVTAEESKAFVERFEIEPLAPGPLTGLRFAVKDVIDIAGRKTSFGNPDWRDQHPVAATNAVCVDQLLSSGACCVGKTVGDELAFSLYGENHFYGTPLNPRAPDRVPGGSSSGSASAVACGLVDFALGTDTAGSVRVPASNCGIFGFRPSTGSVSVAGVVPLAPSFDTVGVFARSALVLAQTAAVLLGVELLSDVNVTKVHILREAFMLADPEVREALEAPLAGLKDRLTNRVVETSIRDIDGEAQVSLLENWRTTFTAAQRPEIWPTFGSWIEGAKPVLGPGTAAKLELVRHIDRSTIADAVRRRESYFRRLARFLRLTDLLCIPTTPALPPLKDTVHHDRDTGNHYPRAISLTSIAGVGRLPQVTLPLADVRGVPVGLSLLAAYRQDAFLLSVAQSL